MERRKILLCCFVLCTSSWAFPQLSDTNSLIVSSTEPSKEGTSNKNEATEESNFPKIYEMNVNSSIANRFAKTLITCKVKNTAKSSQEATFSVVLPKNAFISEFVMEMGGKSYKAYVKEKEEAKQIYDQAVSSGQAAAHVTVSARDSNRFTVSVNVEPESKATFLLTYEELLQRQNGQYELVLNIHPGQIVKNLNVEVHINESRSLTFVKTPSLRSGNEITKNEEKLDPSAKIEITNSTSALVKFNPDDIRQKQYAVALGGKENDGLSGQFIVQYDVERDPNGGEVLLQDGYFVHFFAPNDMEPLPKYVVFVLDTSGSMYGTKITQLKEAMKSILTELKGDNIFNIVEFSNIAQVRDIKNGSYTEVFAYSNNIDYKDPFPGLSEHKFPSAYEANDENIDKAKRAVDNLEASGGTNAMAGLDVGLYLVKKSREITGEKYQPLLIFLTDGEPNLGIGNTEEIIKTTTKINEKSLKTPIFSLSFGHGADKSFLRKLSLKNLGFSRHIYEGVDASIQLQQFYKYISSPLLSNVTFKYDADVEKVTKRYFPIHFWGSELVVTGKLIDRSNLSPKGPQPFPCTVTGSGPKGLPKILIPKVETPVTSLERLWAYLNVKQILEEKDAADNSKEELTKKALDLALKYSFVTDVTSLVVVKPNATSSVNTEDASNKRVPGVVSASLGQAAGPRYHYAMPTVGWGGVIPYSGASFSGRRGGTTMFGKSTSHLHRPSYDLIGSPSHGSNWYPTVTRNIPRPLTVGGQENPLNNSDSKLLEAKKQLPWLQNAMDQHNGRLNISQSLYELRHLKTGTPPHPECPKTPVNGTLGQCQLLIDCPAVFPVLTSLEVYRNYFCAIDNKYAGVCCPK